MNEEKKTDGGGTQMNPKRPFPSWVLILIVILSIGVLAKFPCWFRGDCEVKPKFLLSSARPTNSQEEEELVEEAKRVIREGDTEELQKRLTPELQELSTSFIIDSESLNNEFTTKKVEEMEKVHFDKGMTAEDLQKTEDSLREIMDINDRYISDLQKLWDELLKNLPEILDRSYPQASPEIKNEGLAILTDAYEAIAQLVNESLDAENKCYESRIDLINLVQGEGIDYSQFTSAEEVEAWGTKQFQERSSSAEQQCDKADMLQAGLPNKIEQILSELYTSAIASISKLVDSE